MAGGITAGAILRRTLGVLRAAPAVPLGVWAMLAAAGTAIDLLALPNLFFALLAMATLVAQYQVTWALLAHFRLLPPAQVPGQVGGFVTVSILSGLAVFAGIVLFVLPGIYLFARWAVAMPLVLGEGRRWRAALVFSAARTQPHVGAAMVAVAVAGLPLVAGFAVMLWGYPAAGAPGIAAAFVANGLFDAGLVLVWALAVALHTLLRA